LLPTGLLLGRHSKFDGAGMFHGYEWDLTCGMHHVRNRSLNIATGRWQQRYPLDQNVPAGGYQDGMNLYEYVKSNPGLLVDPTGTVAGAVVQGVMYGATAVGALFNAVTIYDLASGPKPDEDWAEGDEIEINFGTEVKDARHSLKQLVNDITFIPPAPGIASPVNITGVFTVELREVDPWSPDDSLGSGWVNGHITEEELDLANPVPIGASLAVTFSCECDDGKTSITATYDASKESFTAGDNNDTVEIWVKWSLVLKAYQLQAEYVNSIMFTNAAFAPEIRVRGDGGGDGHKLFNVKCNNTD